MTVREIAPTIAVVSLLDVEEYDEAKTAVCDTLGYTHGLQRCNAASLVWNVQAYTDGSHTARLLESDVITGPWTVAQAVNPMFYSWWLNGAPYAGNPTVANANNAKRDFVCSYHGGLKRYIALLTVINTPGTLAYGVDALLMLTETMTPAFTDYEP